jgi:replicative DNA helicase
MPNDRIEALVLRSLVHDDEYARRTLPFIKADYFAERNDRVVFETVKDFFTKYNKRPTIESILIDLSNRDGLSEEEYKQGKQLVEELKEFDKPDTEWLLDATEKFCRKKAVYNAIMESIQIFDGKGNKTENCIPELLSDALAVSFDTHIGHDFIDDYNERFDFYHKIERKMPFDLEYMNKITQGGVPSKTLNVILAGTGVGKSLFMCHHAANCLISGNNVLYITCEMAEERIAERIDANLMDITMDDLKKLPKDIYTRKMQRIMSSTTAKLIIKEYPTATANAMHFEALLDELRLKKNFKPDIVFVDYLNICASSRFKANSNVNSYTYVKAIAEELRGMAVKYDVPIFTATQTNREGFSNSDVELTNTSESFGLPATADFMVALISTEELEELGQLMVKQLKNRYGDPSSYRRFVIGVDRSKMKLFDLDIAAQKGISKMGDKDEDDEIELPDGGGQGFKTFRQKMDGKFYRKNFDEWS